MLLSQHTEGYTPV